MKDNGGETVEKGDGEENEVTGLKRKKWADMTAEDEIQNEWKKVH